VGGLRQSDDLSGVQLFLTFGCNMVMVFDFGFMARHLAVNFVRQFIDGGVQISVGAFGKNIAAFDMHIAFGALAAVFFFHVVDGEQDFDIDDLVKVAGDSIEFAGDIAAKGWGNFKMVAADRHVHKKDSFERKVPDTKTALLGSNENNSLKPTMRA
jgi:hypothetical protein